jgi:hypothetical protein
MTILEDKIRKNSAGYDVHEPPAGHRERFEARLDAVFHRDEARHTRPWLRYAAGLLILAGMAGLLTYIFPGNPSTAVAGQNEELRKVAEYYDRLAGEKLSEINQCAPSGEEAEKINELAMQQLMQLEADAGQLMQELETDASNERVYGALVSNYRTRIGILDRILHHICYM